MTPEQLIMTASATVITAMISGVGAVMGALWFRLGAVQTKLDNLIHDEADCRGQLRANEQHIRDLKASLDNKHAENVALLSRLQCYVEAQTKHKDDGQ